MTRRILALVRPKLLDAGEMDALHALAERLGPERFALTVSRLDVRAGDLVVARHTAWPWPLELALDVRRLGGELLNGPNAYHYADDARQWSADLGDLTPRTWDRFEELPADTAFVRKRNPRPASCGCSTRCSRSSRTPSTAASRHGPSPTGRASWRRTRASFKSSARSTPSSPRRSNSSGCRWCTPNPAGHRPRRAPHRAARVAPTAPDADAQAARDRALAEFMEVAAEDYRAWPTTAGEHREHVVRGRLRTGHFVAISFGTERPPAVPDFTPSPLEHD